MARPKKPSFADSKPVPMRLDPALIKRIDDLADKIGEPKSTVMRMCMRIGLDQLEKVYTPEEKKPETSSGYSNHHTAKDGQNGGGKAAAA